MQGNESQPQQDGWKGAKPWPEIILGLFVIGIGFLGYTVWYHFSKTSVILANLVTLLELVSIGILAKRFRGWLRILWWIWFRNRVFVACTRANEATIAKSPPRLRRVVRLPSGWELHVVLRNGTTQADLENISDSLKSSFKAFRVAIHRGDRGDRAIIEVITRSPFQQPRSTGVLKRFLNWLILCIRSIFMDVDVKGREDSVGVEGGLVVPTIPIGMDESGRGVSIRLGGGLVIGGLPGSGKTNLVHHLIAQFTRLGEAALYLIDPKRVELSGWRAYATHIGVSEDDALGILDGVIAVMEERYRDLERRGARIFARDAAPILVVIEETSALLSGGKRHNEIEQRLHKLMSQGRAAQITVVLVAQRPGVDVIPASLRDLAETRIAFRTSTADMSDVILGRGWASRGIDASSIDATLRGVGYVYGGDGDPKLFRASFLDDTTLQKLQQRQPPGFGSGQGLR